MTLINPAGTVVLYNAFMLISSRLLSVGKIGLVAVAVGLTVCLLILIVWGVYQTYHIEHHPNQAIFRKGIVPSHLPGGFYKGEVAPDLRHGWQGKVFNSAESVGINQFEHDQRFRFKMYPAQGLRDKQLAVLRIDYRQPGNPWWLRFITDEIVQTAPNHYLGKVHLRTLPGLNFTLTYFELTRAN